MRANPNTPHSTRTNQHIRQNSASKNATPGLIRRLMPMCVLAMLFSLHSIVGSGSFSAGISGPIASGLATENIHRADWISEIIDLIDDMLDALDGVDSEEPNQEAEPGTESESDEGEDSSEPSDENEENEEETDEEPSESSDP
jgi:hypothetical protein